MNSKQQDIFEYSIKSTVDDVLNGYNGTVFAYGQTGSGKTFTMMVSFLRSRINMRVPISTMRIWRVWFHGSWSRSSLVYWKVRRIWSIQSEWVTWKYTWNGYATYSIVFLENSFANVAHNDNLPIHEDKSRGVYVKDLLEVYVSSIPEVYEVMRRGGQARVVASTSTPICLSH